MPRIYIPTEGTDDWRQFLAEPDKQWRTGYSAKTLAQCWEAAKNKEGLPPEIASMLAPFGGKPELLLAIPEYKTPLAGSSRGDSQSDVFALVRAGDLTLSVVIEGKVREPFGEKLGDWLQNASTGKLHRLNYICDLLGLKLPLPDHIYYQLLHRTASAVIEGRRFKTDAAAMIVHSFSREKLWFDAFTQFASIFGVTPPSANEFVAIRPNAKPPLYIGWACGDCNFLTA
ncbi:MAG: DUF6946 family protein [Candidatus Acidiferrales bacterium]